MQHTVFYHASMGCLAANTVMRKSAHLVGLCHVYVSRCTVHRM